MSKQEPKHFTSTIEITPVNPYERQKINSDSNSQSQKQVIGPNNATPNSSFSNSAPVKEIPIRINPDIGLPYMTRSRTSSLGSPEIPIVTEQCQTRNSNNSPTMNHKQPHVRHIPIFVEGRKDPVIHKNTDEPVKQSKQLQQEQMMPLKRKFYTNGNSPPMKPSNGETQQKQEPPQEHELSVRNQSHPRPTLKSKTPVERVKEVKEEVENLLTQMNQFNGNSRTDKEYLFLDEMLTRNLIKLDTIEVEGNDSLRTARKDVIKQIQDAISQLESMVPAFKSEEAQIERQDIETDKKTDNVQNAV